jgi:UDPglucose 6-dehydrogenase
MGVVTEIIVWGLGYLGVTHAVAMASLGHNVIGVDIDETKVKNLRQGRSGIYEPGLDEALGELLGRGVVGFATSIEPCKEPRVHFLCVGTPQNSTDWNLSTDQLFSVCSALAPLISERDVVVGKSTVPLGTASKLKDFLEEQAGFRVNLVWNPEFLREGTALGDSLHPDRIVVGAWHPHGVEVLRQIYKPMLDEGTPFLEVGVETAELVKIASNTFLATKISFINAMAEIAEATGADAVELAQALGYDARIGPHYLKNGLGFGGGCLPKDLRGFVASAESVGAGEAVNFLKDVEAINLRRRRKVLDLASQELGQFEGSRVLVLGLSFKPDSDDMRDSPSLDVARQIAQRGARVTVHDPVAKLNARELVPELFQVADLESALRDQDLLILGTEWKEYLALDPKAVGKSVANRTIIDGRNVLDVAAWQLSGWKVIALGRNVHF